MKILKDQLQEKKEQLKKEIEPILIKYANDLGCEKIEVSTWPVKKHMGNNEFRILDYQILVNINL